MITLGIYDSNVQPTALDEYIEHAKKLTGVENWENKLRGEKDGEWADFRQLSGNAMTVADAQRFFHGGDCLFRGGLEDTQPYDRHFDAVVQFEG